MSVCLSSTVTVIRAVIRGVTLGGAGVAAHGHWPLINESHNMPLSHHHQTGISEAPMFPIFRNDFDTIDRSRGEIFVSSVAI